MVNDWMTLCYKKFNTSVKVEIVMQTGEDEKTGNTTQIKGEKGIQPILHYPAYPAQHQMSLLDIWCVLVKQRYWVLGITVAATVISIMTALTMPRVYMAEVRLLPPHAGDVGRLNIPQINEKTVDKVFDAHVRNLQSRALRRKFFNEHNIYDALTAEQDKKESIETVFSDQFNKALSVNHKLKGGEKTDLVTVTLEGGNKDQLTEWLNAFVDMVGYTSLVNEVDEVVTKIELQKESVRNKIESLRQSAEKRRIDRIALLTEQVEIAEKAGIKNPEISQELMPSMSRGGAAENNVDASLYLVGRKLLLAEIETLKKERIMIHLSLS